MLEQLSLCSELGSVGRKCLCFYKEKLWESNVEKILKIV